MKGVIMQKYSMENIAGAQKCLMKITESYCKFPVLDYLEDQLPQVSMKLESKISSFISSLNIGIM